MKTILVSAVAGLLGVSPLWADSRGLLALTPDCHSQDAGVPALLAEQPAKPKSDGPPCPIHTIEGYGGVAMVPTAYLVNPGPKDEMFGLPAASFTFINIGHKKNLSVLAITETLYGRVELGYGLSRFGLGEGEDAIHDATGVNVRDDVYLHNFNARFLVIEENSFNCPWVPAITVGAHLKINQGVNSIDNDLGGALTKTGLESEWGVDFTLTATKMFPKLAFGRPLILTAGLRNSDAAWMGFLGYGDERHFTFEGSAIVLATDWLGLCYEYRQKVDQLDTIPGVQNGEDDMQAMGFAIFPNSHFSIAVLYGIFGHALNRDEDSAVGVQFKWEM